MANQIWKVIEAEKGRETEKAICLGFERPGNYDGTATAWIWCPKSCYSETVEHNITVQRVKAWFFYSNGLSTFMGCENY